MEDRGDERQEGSQEKTDQESQENSVVEESQAIDSNLSEQSAITEEPAGPSQVSRHWTSRPAKGRGGQSIDLFIALLRLLINFMKN